MQPRQPVYVASALQKGVYALEWAMVLPVFFVLLYAIISYGLAFLVRESMQAAIEDGARAALRYHQVPENRLKNVQSMVAQRLQWLPSTLRPDSDSVQVQVCQLKLQQSQTPEQCADGLVCSSDTEMRCLIKVQVVIPYDKYPLTPQLLDWESLRFPPLKASASILVGAGGL